ncbi:unnamed protein product, partial [Laminaria digitata]
RLPDVDEGEKGRVSKNDVRGHADASDDRSGSPEGCISSSSSAVMKTSGFEKPTASRSSDPMAEILLVTDDGERNAWDDLLDEELAKCRPVTLLRKP